MQTRRVTVRRRPGRQALPRSGLGLRLGLSLLLTAAALAARQYRPALLEQVRAQLLANTGEVAEAFARFTGALTEGESAVEAWAELRDDLSASWQDAP